MESGLSELKYTTNEKFLVPLWFKREKGNSIHTNTGYGVGNGFQTVKELCVYCKVRGGFSIKGGVERVGVLFIMKGQKATEAEKEIIIWLKKIKVRWSSPITRW